MILSRQPLSHAPVGDRTPSSRSPHHKRTRSCGEQRGTTGKAVPPDDASTRPFPQVSARNSSKRPQLPKLMVYRPP